MQRNTHIPINTELKGRDLQARVEQALIELQYMINAKVCNYVSLNPIDTTIRLDEETNHLFVYNTSTQEWVEFQPVV